jgi:WD40 repeat protein
VETLSLLRSFEAYSGVDIIPSIALSDDESLIVTAAHNGGYARVFDVETGEMLQELDHNQWRDEGNFWIWDAHFLHNDDWVLSAGETRIALWDWRTGELMWSVDTTPGGVVDLALSPDEQWFVVGAETPPTAQLYQTTTGRLIRNYTGHGGNSVQWVDLSPNGAHFITNSSDGTVVEWPLWWEGTQQVIPIGFSDPPRFARHPTQPLVAIAPSNAPNNDTEFISRASDGTIYIINSEIGAVVQELVGHPELVQGITFSPDGRYLLSGDFAPGVPRDEQQLYVWDWKTGERIAEFSEHEGWVVSIAVSPDGRTVASGDAIGSQIFIWDLQTGEIIHHLTEHAGWIESLVFSPDSAWLYSAGDQGRIFRWDVYTGELVQEYGDQSGDAGRLALTSDGTRLIGSFSSNNSTIVWDTSSGAVVQTFNKGGEIALNPADTLATVYSPLDGLITIWDLTTGEERHRYPAYPAGTYGAITFDASGHQIISAGNGDLIVWEAPSTFEDRSTWILNNRYVADFTCEQRALYAIEPLCEPET